jgi:hypothetical protein
VHSCRDCVSISEQEYWAWPGTEWAGLVQWVSQTVPPSHSSLLAGVVHQWYLQELLSAAAIWQATRAGAYGQGWPAAAGAVHMLALYPGSLAAALPDCHLPPGTTSQVTPVQGSWPWLPKPTGGGSCWRAHSESITSPEASRGIAALPPALPCCMTAWQGQSQLQALACYGGVPHGSSVCATRGFLRVAVTDCAGCHSLHVPLCPATSCFMCDMLAFSQA